MDGPDLTTTIAGWLFEANLEAFVALIEELTNSGATLDDLAYVVDHAKTSAGVSWPFAGSTCTVDICFCREDGASVVEYSANVSGAVDGVPLETVLTIANRIYASFSVSVRPRQ